MRGFAQPLLDYRRAAFALIFCAMFTAPASASSPAFRRVGTIDNSTATANQACYWNGTDLECNSTNPTITATGLVGIGTTTPKSLLDASSASFGTYAGVTAAPADDIVVGGRVGIGSASPTDTLNVVGDIQVDSGFFYNSATASTLFVFDSSGADYGTIQNDAANTWSLGYETAKSAFLGTAVLSWNASGRVGIGSTSPVASLDLSQKTDAVALPVGTTGARPTGVNGMIRYNSTLPGLEAYINGVWSTLQSSGSTSGVLGVPNGGTGDSTLTAHGVVVGEGTSPLAATSAGAIDTVLVGNGSSSDPSFSAAPTLSGTITDLQSIGATSTDGMVLQNTTAATSTLNQWSPRVHFSGQGWKTTATAASQAVDMIEELQPQQGTSNPTGNLTWSSSVNGSAYSPLMTLTSGGYVGIGTTGPQAAVEISGDDTTNPNEEIWFANTGASGRTWRVGDGAGSGNGTFDIRDATAGATRLSIDPNGNVGMGTTTPWDKLLIEMSDSGGGISIQNDLSTTSRYPALGIYDYTGGYGGIPGINFGTSRGSAASPTAVQSGDYLGFIGANGQYDTTSTHQGKGAEIDFVADGVFTSGSYPTDILFSTVPSGSTSIREAMRITSTGQVGIGTPSPAGTLDVEGGTSGSGNGTNITLAAQNGLASGNTNGGNIILTPGTANGTGTAGGVAIGTTSVPANVTEAVNGLVKVAGTGSEPCTASQVGSIRYNPTGNYFELCSYP